MRRSHWKRLMSCGQVPRRAERGVKFHESHGRKGEAEQRPRGSHSAGVFCYGMKGDKST